MSSKADRATMNNAEKGLSRKLTIQIIVKAILKRRACGKVRFEKLDNTVYERVISK